jgi:uncharacterized protein (DUF433 family)
MPYGFNTMSDETLSAGMSHNEIITDFPELTQQDILAMFRVCGAMERYSAMYLNE